MIRALTIAACLLTCSTASAQQQPKEMVTVEKSKLPSDLIAQIEQDNLKAKIEQYGSWVGIGKEVGVAVNEGLQAVSANAAEFAQTDIGKLTITVIVWKVVGREILGVMIGVPLLLLVFFIFWRCWRSIFWGKLIFEGARDEKGHKQYRFIEPTAKSMGKEEAPWTAFGLILGLLVSSISIVCGVIF